MAEPWKVNGTYFEACNCAAACPCVFLSAPTEGTCTVLLAWHIDKGNFGAMQLNGLNVALLATAPGHMMQTKWKVALYLDDKASGDQQKALGAIFSGQAGGHLAVLGPLIGEVMGVKPVPIEFLASGKQRSAACASRKSRKPTSKRWRGKAVHWTPSKTIRLRRCQAIRRAAVRCGADQRKELERLPAHRRDHRRRHSIYFKQPDCTLPSHPIRLSP